MDTLPEDSATKTRLNGWAVSIEPMLIAMVVDTLRQIGVGLGGKKLGKDKLLVPHLTGEDSRSKTENRELADRLRKRLQAESIKEDEKQL